MDSAWVWEYFKNAGPASGVTFILGFMVSRFTMTKKEKKDYQQTLYENGQELMEKQNDRFQEFAAALKKYVAKGEAPTLDDFYEIATTGEKYFYQQQITSEAILAGKVDASFRNNTLVPKIAETLKKSLPRYYSSLQAIAQKNNFPYSGTLQRKNYESLYLVVERFGQADRHL
jgi:hypothetical protein